MPDYHPAIQKPFLQHIQIKLQLLMHFWQDLLALQKQDNQLQLLLLGLMIYKNLKLIIYKNLSPKKIHDRNKNLWICLDDPKYPRTALYLTENTAKWPSANHIITNSVAITLCLKLATGSPLHTISQKYFATYKDVPQMLALQIFGCQTTFTFTITNSKPT